MTRLWVLLVVCACSFRHGEGPGSDAPDFSRLDGSGAIDGAKDGSSDGNGAYCYGSAPFGFCLAGPPSSSFDLNGVLDTGTANDTTCESIGHSQKVMVGSVLACAISGTDITVQNMNIARGRGSLPLVIHATGTLTIDGEVAVASDVSGRVGPGADPMQCTTLGIDGTSNGGCGGGGAGGSFGSHGGNGGTGNGVMATIGTAGAAVASPVTVLRGGCQGGNGGAGGGTAGTGMPGGGAVYLVAGTMMTITGTIDASGSGGGGAQASKAGGGGAGSGGMIVLSSPIILATGARIVANGGGGGGGADNGSDGTAGNDPSTSTVTTPAGGGGGGGAAGGNGGNGAAGTTGVGPSGNANGGGGGGGGGGGIGVIRVLGGGTLAGALVSPLPS